MDFTTILATDNLAEALEGEELGRIGSEAVEGYRNDLATRSEWEQSNADVLRMAMQVVQQKTFPWQGAANIDFPLIALACVNFQSRAVAEAIPSGAVAMCKGGLPLEHIVAQVTQNVQQQVHEHMLNAPLPKDPAERQQQMQQMQQLQQQQIQRQVQQTVLAQNKFLEKLGEHMTFQMQELDEFEEKTDLLMAILPLAGCVVKKTYFDPEVGHNRSDIVLPNDFIVNYWAKGEVEDLPRVSQWFSISKNEMAARIREGRYLDGVSQQGYTPDATDEVKDERQGITQGRLTDADIELIEQHTWLDLDEDGYCEPYIVTVDIRTQRVRRIIKRFDAEGVKAHGKKIMRIKPQRYFTKYLFMQSPDGGWYGQSFGALLKSINEISSGVVNRLLDAGTLAITAGGFLSKEVRIKGGNYEFRPNEWKRADCSAQALKDGIVPLPVRGPDAVLLQLFQYLIEYGERVVGATDMLTGITPGQNTPAETSRNSLEQGLKVYSGIMRRVYRAMQREFRLWYELNQKHYEGDPFDVIPQGAYRMTPSTVVFPAMNPNVMSDSAKLTQAQALLQAAGSVPPGMYNMYEVQKLYVAALKIKDSSVILPDPTGPLALPAQAPMPIQVEQAKGQISMQVEQIRAQAKLATEKGKIQLGVAKLMQQAEEAKAKIELMEAQAKNQTAMANSEPVMTAVHAANAELEYMKAHHRGLLDSLTTLHKIMQETQQDESGNVGKVAGATGNATSATSAGTAQGGYLGGSDGQAAPVGGGSLPDGGGA